jgi:4-diphosphocytidyl-2-C-methyl-D-erythritol kinase
MSDFNCSVEAHAKVNLHLRVGERRPDGFHAIETILAPISLSDTLEIRLLDRAGELDLVWDCRVPLPAIPAGAEDLAARAVYAFRERTGFDAGLGIRLIKRIPLGAGLGGGSSDAAALLGALNRLSGTPLDGEALAETALSLGSDLPFFLHLQGAYADGRGERLRPLPPLPPYPLVLVYPGFAAGTADAYRSLDAWRARHGPSRGGEDPSGMIRALSLPPGEWPWGNDFLEPWPEGESGKTYRKILESMRREGAAFASLSGSGSVCFAVFEDAGLAASAAAALAGNGEWVSLSAFL